MEGKSACSVIEGKSACSEARAKPRWKKSKGKKVRMLRGEGEAPVEEE